MCVRRREPSSLAPLVDQHPSSPHILVLTASMGEGHTGAALELSRRLGASGFGTTVRDFLDSGRFRSGHTLKWAYRIQLRYLPDSYETTYQMWFKAPWLCGPLARFVAMLTAGTLSRWISETRPAAVVSTYPLATLALGELRRTGRLNSPVINYITDFGVHPLWVHRCADLHLAVHPSSAELARVTSGGRTLVSGPAVSDAFDARRLPERQLARAQLGISDSDSAVLVSAGSWGVGSVEHTVREIALHGDLLPVVACGRDERLRARLDTAVRRGALRALVVGWTDDMPALMAACDALVENAGGLTAFEAMRAGLPVVTYKPIPGHGRQNAAAMSAAGVARTASDPSDLRAVLDEVVRRGRIRNSQVAAGAGLFCSDPADAIRGMVSPPTSPLASVQPMEQPA